MSLQEKQETAWLKCRSTSFAFDGEKFRQSIITEDEPPKHIIIEYTPGQAALINKQAAAYVWDRVAPLAKPID